MKAPLLKWQRNEVFEAIQTLGLNPREFEWIEREVTRGNNKSRLSPVLVHQPTEYYYAFYEEEDGTHWPVYSPGPESLVLYLNLGTQGWQHKITNINRWLDYLKREVEAPDLWEALSQDLKFIDAASDLEDTPFSQQELTYISSALKEIKEYIVSTQNLTSDKLTYIESRLDYLEKSSKRQGRQAWIHTTIGVLFTIVVGAAFAPDAARDLFRFAANALSQIINSPLLLP